MSKFGNIAMGALMMAGTAIGATVATTAPASAAHVSVGIGIGVPVVPVRGDKCYSRQWAYMHPQICGYAGPNYYGYYDTGYFGPGYYEPAANGFWFVDFNGHRRWHAGRFYGRGFHRGGWHRGWHRWSH
ncbi:MAG TPA: hypothetical protein VLC29_09425 [Rhizomicrobium sp.]|nr:hypothetical protein [Rhizomicrobium sp.]